MSMQLDPKEHADVIIGACYGDLEIALSWTEVNRKTNPQSEGPYWDSVAKEIALRKSNAESIMQQMTEALRPLPKALFS